MSPSRREGGGAGRRPADAGRTGGAGRQEEAPVGGAPAVEVRESLKALAGTAADRLLAAARAAIAARGRFTLAVSGGSTPVPLYERLAAPAAAGAVDWSAVWVFWADDRWVPHDHPDSNVKLVRDHWLARSPSPPGRVYPPRSAELGPDEAAADYAAVIRTAFGIGPLGVPRFDLHLLGVGEDGHTASLFPDHPALEERERLVVAPWIPQLRAYRITLTLPVFNRGREVWMLAAGSRKAPVVRRVFDQLRRPVGPDTLPAARIRPAAGRLLWLLDEAAAAALPPEVRRA